MKLKTISLLTVLAVAAASSLILLPQDSNDEQQSLFPELSTEQLNNINSISMTSDGETLELLRDDNKQWQLVQADNYPANTLRIREVLSFFLALKVEEKTSYPEYYSRLGVEDPDSENAQSKLLKISDGSNHWGLIIGSPSKQMNSGQYVRKLGAEKSWLVDKKLILRTEIDRWWQEEIVHIPRSEIKQITATYTESTHTLAISRETDKDTLMITNDIGSAGTNFTHRINQISAVTDYMKFKKLGALADKEASEQISSIVYTTFQGLKLSLDTYQQEEETLFTVVAETEETASQTARELAKTINTLCQNRVYVALNTTHKALGVGLKDIFQAL